MNPARKRKMRHFSRAMVNFIYLFIFQRGVRIFFHYRDDVCMWDWGSSQVVLLPLV